MSTRSYREISCRSSSLLVIGMILAPCGLVLDLTATVASNWRTLHNIPSEPPDVVLEQGIWTICRSFSTSTNRVCNQPDDPYFGNRIIEVAQGLMVASPIVTLAGLAVAVVGVRPGGTKANWIVVGLAGLLLFCSGVLTIIPIAWYTHILKQLDTATVTTDIRVGFCIILGYIGGVFEVIAGFGMFIGICSCKIKRRGRTRREEATADQFNRQMPLPGRVEVHSPSRTLSDVSYRTDSTEIEFKDPRLRSYNSKPYDVDL